MNIDEIEKYIAGSDEVNRQRQVITRVISAVINGLWAAINWEDLESAKPFEIFSVDLPEASKITFQAIVTSEKTGIFRRGRWSHHDLKVKFEAEGKEWQIEDSERINFFLAHRFVSELYRSLPEIVERANSVPGSNTKAHFDFFIQQAPAAK